MHNINRSAYEALLLQVDHPGRYLGNERGAARKDLSGNLLRFALAFPEVYEIAQSHPGLQILYDLLNRRTDVYAERAYAPWIDLERLLRQRGLPLVSLETFTPLRDFDIVGFSLQYELTYTTLLAMLDLGGIPIEAAERSATDPLVIAGGPCAFNPEPLADFLDAVLLGDGEEAVHDICDVYQSWDGRDRSELLRALSQVQGVYVPSLYRSRYGLHGRLLATEPINESVEPVVRKRILSDLNRAPIQERYVVPNMKVVHARPSIEVMRGCVKGCRFCQAGYIYRPLRERDPQRVLAQVEQAVTQTGTNEISLLSLSTGDYSCVNPVLTELMNRYAAERVAVSLPSTRVDALAPKLLEQIKRVRKTGFTLAPEAGSQRMRNIIQKEYEEEELIAAAKQIFDLGWRSVKLYFMIGLPGETEEDLLGIADLAAKVRAVAPRRAEVTASISTFSPKAHTPFQWVAQIDIAETERRQAFLRGELYRRGVRFKWHDARESYLEGLVARGDRRMGRIIRRAFELGCRFDGWTEQCRLDLWEQAMHEHGMDPTDCLRRRRLDEPLPWDHIDSGVTKKFLQEELARAVEGLLTPDCSVERCTYCGACDFKQVRNVDYHVEGAKGSDHRGAVIDNWAQITVGSGVRSGSWEPRGWQKIRARVARGQQARRRATPIAADSDIDPFLDSRSTATSATSGDGSAGLGNAEEWLGASSEGLGSDLPPGAVRPACRVRFTYTKLGRSRFISHLELIEVFASACKRARLPVAFTQGHHPAPRFRFSPGLPLGMESQHETLDVDFSEKVDAAVAGTELAGQLPEGMSVVRAEVLPLNAPAVERTLDSVRYRIPLAALERDPAQVRDRIANFLASEQVIVRRFSKKGERLLDARKLVQSLSLADDAVMLELRFSHEGSVKPSDLLAEVFSLDSDHARALPILKQHCFYRVAAPAFFDSPQSASPAAVV